MKDACAVIDNVWKFDCFDLPLFPHYFSLDAAGPNARVVATLWM